METGDLKNKNESDLQELVGAKSAICCANSDLKSAEKQLKDVRRSHNDKKDIARRFDISDCYD